jgi:hypothetical protein
MKEFLIAVRIRRKRKVAGNITSSASFEEMFGKAPTSV